MFQNLKFLVIFLCLKGLLSLVLIQYYGIGLSPDEAQYWLWGTHLDWGYYSKPPGIAWLLFLSTSILGDSLIGVRVIPVVCSIILSLLIYRLVRVCGGDKRLSFWGGMIMAFSPVGILSSFAATTDGPFLIFWVLAFIELASGLRKGGSISLSRIGVIIGCGLLFKWTLLIFWGIILCLRVYKKEFKGWFLGVLFTLLGFLPSVIWNSSHDWVTFKHVLFHNILGSRLESKSVINGNFFDFFGVQFAILSPVFFILLLYSWFILFRSNKKFEVQWKVCGWSSCILLGIYLFISIFSKIQPNWALFALPAGVVWMLYCVKRVTLWCSIGVFSSLILSVFVICIPFLQREGVGYPIPWKFDMFRHSLGWDSLTPLIKKYESDFLFADTYQMASILSFYSPKKERAYFLNLQNRRKNQFDFWPQWDSKKTEGEGLFFTLSNNSKECEQRLIPYFKDVNYLGKFSLFQAYGKTVKDVLIFRCNDFNGDLPITKNSY